MLFSFKVAFRFLKEGKHQTLFILIGIILGVSVQVYISNMIHALDINLLNSTIGNASQLTIEPKQQDNDENQYINQAVERNKINQYQNIINLLENIKQIKAVSPSVQGNALYSRANKSTSLLVKGIKLNDADKIYDIRDNLEKGEFTLSSNQILVGSKFAKDNKLKIGDTVKLNFSSDEQIPFFISAIFDLKNEQTNSTLAFIDLSRAQKIMNLEGSVNLIETQLKDPFDSQKVKNNIEEFIKNVDISIWQEKNKSLMSAIRGQRSASAIIQIFVIIAVALSMSSVLAVSVIQKSKEIGILKAMGTTDIDTSMIFIIQGGTLGFLGSLFGYGFGVVIIKFFFNFLNKVTESNYIYDPSMIDFVSTVIVATIVGMISSAIPARKSASLNPMEVIRNA